MSIKPKLAFVSLWNAADPNAESGYAYSMRRQLRKRFDVVDVFPPRLPGERLFLPMRAAYKMAGLYYHPMREPAVLKALARRVERRLKDIAPDVVFAPSSIPLSFVDTPAPRMFSTDQVFGDFIGAYIPNASARYRRQGDAQEGRALATAAWVSYPSHWAARSAVERHGADAAKISVIPWGANLPRDLPDAEIAQAIAGRRFDHCRLVFLGRDWRRKGGDVLVATVIELNRRGLPTTATIIGCDPPSLPQGLFTVHPFLDKRNPNDFIRLAGIMLEAHFHFLPSKAEAYGQAFCEAAAFGLPSIGSTAGGIPTIIRDAVTGFTRPADLPAADFAALIEETLGTPARYIDMAKNARQDYRDRLNWDRFGERLNETVAALV
jgi:glycosyltransferase involved in cell wall biosynthesis